MAVRNCCVVTCASSSSREEDKGVTYLKFPKDPTLRGLWVSVTRFKNTEQPFYICSRHFCKNDFEKQNSKYVLKSDAVPSIFSWHMEAITENSSESKMDVDNTETIISQEKGKQDEEPLNSSKESEAENLEAIKDFIAAQEQEIIDIRTRKKNAESEAEKEAKASENHLETEASIAISLEDNHNDSRDKQDDIISTSTNEQTSPSIIKHLAGVTDEDVNYLVDVQHDISHDDIAHSVDVKEDINSVDVNEDMTAEAAHVMDMLLTETEAKLAAESESKAGELEKKSPEKPTAKQIMSTFEKGKTMALSVGSKVEARDFGEDWHPAQILEVDFEEMEVLVHYESINKKLVRPDEWISVSSPRLRPEGSGPLKPPTPSPEQISEPDESAVTVKEEIKHEEKPKLTFEAGERCLARWRDNRRFIATIGANLGEGVYEIVFDDGVRWSCNKTRLSKLKDCLDTSLPYTSTPSPDPGPSGSQPPLHSQPLYHTHLFDPARDYLGTKSERRERKRKLNIKEIFNIGQKKPKILDTPKTSKPRVRPPPKDRKPKVVKKPLIVASEVKVEIKDEIPSIKINEVPEAVASIIGTVQEELKQEEIKEIKEETSEFATDDGNNTDTKIEMDDSLDLANSETLSAPESFEIKLEDGQGVDGEARLEKFEQQDNSQSGEVIDRIKEVITKLEDGLSEIETKTDIIKNIDSPKVLIKEEDRILADLKPVPEDVTKKNLAKVKKGKKLRLLQEKKVKKQVERVKSELEVMKKQMEEMKQAMLMKTEEIAKGKGSVEIPESFLLPGEWCCKWVNGQPVGTVSEMEGDLRIGVDNKPGLPRRSVQVEDKRLPPGWTKHMVRRSFGTSAGKWDVVLVSPENRRFHTKTEMRHYFEHNPSVAESLKEYQPGLFDFGVHLKLSRRMGWYTVTPDGQQSAPTFTLPAGTLSTTSPLVKRKKLSLTKKERRERDRLRREKDRDRHNKSKLSKSALLQAYANYPSVIDSPRIDEPQAGPSIPSPILQLKPPPPPSAPEPLEAGFVFVGSLKVQIIENLLRCPAEGCFKNFRNNTLLKMHIKHYHRELTKMLGITPKVLDLAYARTRPSVVEMRKLKLEAGKKTIKVKLPKLPKRSSDKHDPKDVKIEPQAEPTTPVKADVEKTPRSVESPKLRQALGKPVKRRPKVLLPVRKPVLPETAPKEIKEENIKQETPLAPKSELPIEPLDFETAISTHTVTKPGLQGTQKKRKSFASVSKIHSEDDDWMGSDPDTRSSYPRSGTPDSKNMDHKLMSSESNEDQKDANNYMYTETGERIKIVHMKREEIINCHCGFREEDGLMVQCELCLCWQHALCHNIQKESDVPDKYTCSICLNPRRGRRSQRFLHDQDRLYEGLLPGAKPCETLRRSHELSGNLLRIEDALHALKVKYFVATKKDHPKLYLWAKDWETGEISIMQEKLNSDYSDLNIMISSIGKENLPIKDEKDMQLEIKTPPSEDTEIERFSQKDNQIGSQALLSGLLSSPGGASLDLPISTSELERLAKTVQEEAQRVAAPQPEAAIENSACRERLLRHIQRCQALVDARLDSIEAQVAELESQDPSFEDDETADFFPRTKQTVQMLMRDLDTMEELGVIT